MIKMAEYAKRRKDLMKKIGADGIVVLPAAPELIRNGDTAYAYRPNSDFYYLTGFEEPEAVLVLAPDRDEGEYILFGRMRDRDREVWDGPRAGQEGARKTFLANQSYSIEQFADLLPSLIANRKSVHYPVGIQPSFDQLIMNTLNKVRAKIRSGMQSPIEFIDISPSLHEMRLFKSAEEIAVMQAAVDITEKAHVAAMKACKPGIFEYELEAELTYQFQLNGARFPAYPSIVGSGKNTCVLHYVSNNAKIKNGDLVLIDAGAEYQYYAADITRTFPADGKFSAEQHAVYEVVLAAQLAGIKAVRPGASWTAPQEAIVKILTQGLIDLGILKGNLSSLIEKEAYFPFYMHRSGHWLGLDVHDVGRYRNNNKWRNFAAGMVLTVEPGLYISADIPSVSKRWHNIGVRIEDDVVVTDKGCRVLSQKIPKKIDEIEAIMGK